MAVRTLGGYGNHWKSSTLHRILDIIPSGILFLRLCTELTLVALLVDTTPPSRTFLSWVGSVGDQRLLPRAVS